MNLSNLREFISTLAVITTVLQFLSGILVCKQYVIKKTTAETTHLPFICGVLSCCLWLLYGLVKPDNLIILVNIIGEVLMIAYIIIFYTYTIKKATVMKQIIITAGYVVFMVFYTIFEENADLLLTRLGFMACGFTLLTVAAPMSKLFHVFKVKNTECLPFPMILMSFFVSLLWFFYGIIEEDSYLLLPNSIGTVLAMLQLSLFVIFPTKPSSTLVKHIIAVGSGTITDEDTKRILDSSDDEDESLDQEDNHDEVPHLEVDQELRLQIESVSPPSDVETLVEPKSNKEEASLVELIIDEP